MVASISLPRCVTSSDINDSHNTRQIRIFCDASEQAYGSVACLRTNDDSGRIQLAFVLARSKVAPKRRLTIPRLELRAALNGAQLAKLLKKTELTVEMNTVTPWTDSTAILARLKSESYRFKVFVGTGIAEIRELTTECSWRYVDSSSNPADDLTRGKTLLQLSVPDRWSQGPSFLLESESVWPVCPSFQPPEIKTEQRKGIFCRLMTEVDVPDIPDSLEATVQGLIDTGPPSAVDYQTAEWHILQKSQMDTRAWTVSGRSKLRLADDVRKGGESSLSASRHEVFIETFSQLLMGFLSDGFEEVYSELYSDNGTNFHGGQKELREAFASLAPSQIQLHLAKQKISFHFNPPGAPHFGGVWEREMRSVKTALRITVSSQVVTEEVLQTVLIEVEGMLNSKPLGYTSSNVAADGAAR
ncbi:guanine nucleotide-binding protein G(I)/G(S)/G(O) subunit gamma-2 [Pimephales promelas]|nr:guanine nucleotide-binding protein G(I)/G(S)/G(O) subunit gamma-2 [Pimephales promelas]